MYTIILAEDEEDVREAIARGVDWEALGFRLIDSAENGKEAWEQIGRQAPDVLLTDIKMPFMDGLELTHLVKSRYPATRVVILSGCDEFEYAQRALKLQVEEYVLKPFSTQELIEVMGKVKRSLDAEAAEKQNVDLLKEHYRRSLPVLRENFLTSLITGRLKKREIAEKCALYDISLEGSGFQAAVIRMDGSGSDIGSGSVGAPARTPDAVLAPSPSLKDSEDQELKLFAVLNIAEELASAERLGRVFLHNGQVVLLTLGGDDSEEEINSRTQRCAEEIRQSIERYLKLTVTIGIGLVVEEPSGLSHSYKDAVQALDYRSILGGNRTISIADVEKRHVEKVRLDELHEEALIRCIKLGTAAELEELADGLFSGLLDKPVSVKEYRLYLMEIATAVLKAAKDTDAELEEVFGEDAMPFAELNRFKTLQEARGWLVDVCTRLMKSIAVVRQSSYRNLVEEAVAYTRAHYQDSDISIHKVCQHLHISTGYFSSIFKKEMKLTFVGYLQHIRMEAAKELLRTTDLKAFEVAERVGYAEPNYFSFSFKKHVGVSPKEYRSSTREG